MNTSSQFHTPDQELPKQTHSYARKFASTLSVVAVINAGIPAPLSTSTRHIMDDTTGKAMTFVPPSPKTEANVVSNSRNILVKYRIQPGDKLGSLACVFWVTVENFMKYNPQIKRKDNIYAGDTLIVPNPSRNIAKCVKIQEKIPQGVQTATDTEEIQSLRTPREARKAFLKDDGNVRLLVDYAKIYYLDDFNDIYWSKKISVSEKKSKLLKLYEADHTTFGKRPYVKAIRSAEFDPHITKNTEIILKEAWYDSITAKDFLEAKTRIESSGWRFIESIKEAQELTGDYWRIQQRIEALKENHDNITDMGEMQMWRQDFAKQISLKSEANKGIADNINKAVKQIVWDENDIWPHGITPGWVQNEMKKGWNPGCELKRINDINHLRQEVIKIFAEAVKDNLSPEQIMKRLIALDSRFDEKLMWNAVLFSFNRICTWFIKQWKSTQQSVRKANIAYNWHGGKAEDYAQKMHMTLGLISALNKAQSGLIAQNTAPIKHKNKHVAPVGHGIDHTKVRATPVEKGKCSKTTQIDLWRFGAENIVRWDAIDLFHQWQKDGTGILFDDLDKLKECLLSRAKEWKVLWDFTADTSTAKKGKKGHRFPLFVEIEKGEPFILDSYYWDGERPVPFDLYMERHFEKHFKGKVVLNTRVWKIVNAKAEFIAKPEKQPTPMKVMMASAPAEKASVSYMVNSNGTINLSQNVSASVVKLTDTVARDNRLHTDADVWYDKMPFPALTSADLRKTISRNRARTDIIIWTINDPEKKKTVKEKLGDDPEWTLAKNIELQMKRHENRRDKEDRQALKNAHKLHATLVMSDKELEKISALNMMAA